ncbi:hypothetical protein MATR_13570 [Marivirga tractuosa]|uniref:Uncharacterized protein n=1 Tax=Marivirga tractuosa (strain ATCC 23168 / DSM 4126 / NBRC 15989 / NCIMB 1408 / VKM B-1430 / H-43) TaxID=643867 RepID=E4TU85_MARTH|nr:hypothetical protein [Marivirga tractuosa]ADR21013.1 hypothetical protein Ftrac_1016 [Marivirga tractuosa DSM 4126]BDD14532.1 hypothetical protein MATR_13570 [Marivirga tractuosa]
MKKVLIIFLLSMVLPVATFAQLDLDYEDDINPYFLGDSADLVFPILYDFFKYNNDHPATNIQLALIFEERYRNAHPIADYESAIANAERAELLFGRSRDLIDDRETRRNAWYYPNFTNEFKRNGKPEVEFDSVKLVFQQGLKDADSFLTHMPSIHQNFMKMVEQYDLASKNFVRINGDYNSLKDVYLLFDDELESRFDLVKSSYDSTLYYFKKYKEAAMAYPPFDLDQKISINPIKTYRLDGLVIQTDFLVDDIGLWDYGTWVDQVKKVISTEINLLRTDIEKIEKKLDDSFAKMENWVPNDSINLDPIERKSIYKIRRYDLNSPVANVFQYKDDKLDLINEQKSLSVYDTAQDISFQVKLYTINRVFQQTISLENDLRKYNSEIPNSNLNKNKEFYQKYYGGMEGIKAYFESEEKELLNIRSESAKKLKRQIVDHLEEPYLQEIPIYRGVGFEWQMPGLEYDSLEKNIAFINYSAKNVNDLEYFSGFYFDPDSVSQAFYGAKMGSKVRWYNAVPSFYGNGKVWQKVKDINVAGGGDLNFLVYESHADSLDFTNRILVSDESGEIKNEIEVHTQEQPVELTSLRNSNFQLALYQGDGLGDALWPTNLTIVKFHPDSSDYSIKEIDINGKYTGVFQTEKGIVVSAQSEDNKNIYLSLLDNNFNTLANKAFSFKEPIEIKYNYQVSGESLHLLSTRGEKGHLVFTDQFEIRYSDTPLIKEGI